jgi:hypothetical protein
MGRPLDCGGDQLIVITLPELVVVGVAGISGLAAHRIEMGVLGAL